MFLSPENLSEHNLFVDKSCHRKFSYLWWWDIFNIYFFGWVIFSHSHAIFETTPIWIDIFFNYQNCQDMSTVLEIADNEYKTRAIHLVLSTDGSFQRAWILNELLRRREVKKFSTLITAGGNEGLEIKQIQK